MFAAGGVRPQMDAADMFLKIVVLLETGAAVVAHAELVFRSHVSVAIQGGKERCTLEFHLDRTKINGEYNTAPYCN